MPFPQRVYLQSCGFTVTVWTMMSFFAHFLSCSWFVTTFLVFICVLECLFSCILSSQVPCYLLCTFLGISLLLFLHTFFTNSLLDILYFVPSNSFGILSRHVPCYFFTRTFLPTSLLLFFHTFFLLPCDFYIISCLVPC